MITTRKNELALEVRSNFPDKETDFLLISDVHFDNPMCDRKLFFRLLDEARERNAKVLVNGDFFCMMQGRNDRRGSKGKVLPQHQRNNYFDAVIREAAELLMPYADLFLLFADGNHETAIVKHNEINPLDMLVTLLEYGAGYKVHRAGYHGFIKFVYQTSPTSNIRSNLLYHHHGKYGGAVTMGVLGVKRHQAIIRDVDIVWTGHTHDLWHLVHPGIRVDRRMNVRTVNTHHVKTGTFKDEFNQPGGFGVEKLNKPAALGGYWMRFAWDRSYKEVWPKFEVAN